LAQTLQFNSDINHKEDCQMNIKKMIVTGFICIGIVLPLVSQAAIPNKIKTLYDADTIIQNSITIDAPDIAENGAVVTVKIKKINSLPQGVHVTDIILFNNFRKEPIASYKLGSKALPTGLITRVKMRDSGTVYAIAKLSNGKIFSGEKLIKVTEGGCGGG